MALEIQDFLIQQRAKSVKVFEHKGHGRTGIEQ